MDNFNIFDIEQQVLDFMRQLDASPAPYERLFIDDALHRYDIDGDRRGSKCGAYCIHPDGIPAGFVQDWKRNTKANWKFDTSDMPQEQRNYYTARKVAVMESGRVVERSDNPAEFFASPKHPYSQGLIREARKMELEF